VTRLGGVRIEIPARHAHESAHKHLRDLHDRDEIGREILRDFVHSLQAKVAVHKGVDRKVHSHEVEPRGGSGGVRMPAIQQLYKERECEVD